MEIFLTRRDGIAAVLGSIGIGLVAIYGERVFGVAAIPVSISLSTLLILCVIIEVYRRMLDIRNREGQARDTTYRQTEALFSLFFSIAPEYPLPEMRRWAASPDLLRTISEIMHGGRPRFLLEVGSGVSTVVIAHCFRKLGAGRVVALEHEEEFANKTKRAIALHGLGDFATVIHAPLKAMQVHGREWLWYDMNGVELDTSIDILFVDGPPGSMQKLSRYPALPRLYSHLSPNAIIVLDDAKREDEAEIMSMWEQEFPDLDSDYLDLEKGAFIIRRGV